MLEKKSRNLPETLAIFGAQPRFETPLHVGRPNIGDRRVLDQRIQDLLDRRWLSNDGPFVQEFEERIASLIGVRHCIATCNATIALEIVVRATGLSGQVIVPSFTFIATAHALQWQEITPVFCDIDPVSHNIDPAKVEELITPLTTGIIGVHLWGRACDVEMLEKIAERHDLKLLFDAAHAFGCSHDGRMIGSFGDAEVFSFHATKFLNTFEGGAIVTNSDELAGKVRLMRNFGFAGYDHVIYLGTNGKMNEVSAAMGLTGLESMDELKAINQRNYRFYGNEIDQIDGIEMAAYDERLQNNYQYIVLEIDELKTGLARDEILSVLQAEKIMARRYFYPGCHRMEPYRSNFPHSYLLLPETERLAQRTLCLPTGSTISPAAISTICSVIRTAIDNSQPVREMLQEPDQFG